MRPDERVERIASRQHLVVTSAQLYEAGLSPKTIAHRVATGRLTRLHHGVHRLGPADAPRTREAAALLACGPGSHLSHHTAGTRYGLPLDAGALIHVTTPNRRTHANLEIHRASVPRADRALREGLRLTAPARTLSDLAPLVDARTLRRLVEEAQVLKLVTRPQLERFPTLREAAASYDTPSMSRSKAERLLLELVRDAGLSTPETNTYVNGFEVDLLWSAERVVVEMDSWDFHSSRAAFERDRARDQDLIARGYVVIRVTWRQILHERERFVARLAAALAGGDARARAG